MHGKPASEAQISDFERRFNVRLPAEMESLYRASNGFEAPIDDIRFLPLEEIEEHWSDPRFTERSKRSRL